jgi:hypothetical protein
MANFLAAILYNFLAAILYNFLAAILYIRERSNCTAMQDGYET